MAEFGNRRTNRTDAYGRVQRQHIAAARIAGRREAQS